MGNVVVWGAGSTAVLADNPPGSHSAQAWGGFSDHVLQAPANLGGGLVLTTSQAFGVSPWPRCYIYDVVVSYTAYTGATAPTVDIYNAISGGTSYLSAPIGLVAVVTAPQVISARFESAPALTKQHDPLLGAVGIGGENWSLGYSYARGQVFSLRVSTAAAGSLTNLSVSMILGYSNEKKFSMNF